MQSCGASSNNGIAGDENYNVRGDDMIIDTSLDEDLEMIQAVGQDLVAIQKKKSHSSCQLMQKSGHVRRLISNLMI